MLSVIHNEDKTFINCKALSAKLHRPAFYIIKYFGYMLKGNINMTQSYIEGYYEKSVLDKVLNRFVYDYVYCPDCKLNNSVLVVRDERVCTKCINCQNIWYCDNKFNKYILKYRNYNLSKKRG